MDNKKYCPKCDTDKDPSEFGNDRSRKDGKAPYCKICHLETNREWRRNNTRSIAESNYKKRLKRERDKRACVPQR